MLTQLELNFDYTTFNIAGAECIRVKDVNNKMVVRFPGTISNCMLRRVVDGQCIFIPCYTDCWNRAHVGEGYSSNGRDRISNARIAGRNSMEFVYLIKVFK